MSQAEIIELDKGISSLNLTKEDQAYKSFRQYFMIRLHDLLNPVKTSHIRLFFAALKTWNGVIGALQKNGNPEVIRKNALCRTANGLYSHPFLAFINILPTIQNKIPMFKTSDSGPVMTYIEFVKQQKQPGGKNAIVVSKCSMYAFNYDDVRTNVKNYIEYIVKNSEMTRVYEVIFLHDAEKINQFLLQLYGIVDVGITSVESFMSTLYEVTSFLIVDNMQPLGTKNEINILIDYSNMYLNPGFHFNPDNVKIKGNIQGLIDDLKRLDEIIEKQAQIQERRHLNVDQSRAHQELERIRALQQQQPPQQPQLSDEERQLVADRLVALDKQPTKSAKSTNVEHETRLAHEKGIDYTVFQTLFKCSFSELLRDADTISNCSDSEILQYLSNSNLSRYMKFTELNAKYLLIIGYLKNKVRTPFLLCGRSALQMNCVLLDTEITRASTLDDFFTAFQKSCTDFDCQFLIAAGTKPKETFWSVYNLFLNGHHIFMAHDARGEIPQHDFFKLKMQNKQILEIGAQHSDKTIKVKESDGHFFHSVCDITFVPTTHVTPLIQLFLTNPGNLKLVSQSQQKLTELDISFQFPNHHSLLFECVGIVHYILRDFKTPQSEETEKIQFFHLLKFAARACQCAYLINLQSRMLVNIHVILRAESDKFDNGFILEILNLFLESQPSGITKLNNMAYRAFQSYKEKGIVTQFIKDAYQLLQHGLSQQAGKHLTFSLGGGKMVKNINQKLKNTKKYKRFNKKRHTRRKNKRQSLRVKM